MAEPRILSRREYFWRQLLPGAEDEESREIILGFIEEELRGAGDLAEPEDADSTPTKPNTCA